MVLFLAELCKMPRAMWAGIAAMSAIVPLMADMQARVKNRIIGNVAGVLCFLVLYTLLPTSNLCLYRNPWRYRRWLFCEVWLAGSV